MLALSPLANHAVACAVQVAVEVHDIGALGAVVEVRNAEGEEGVGDKSVQEGVRKAHGEIAVVEECMGPAQCDAQVESEVQDGNHCWLLSHQPGHHRIARQDK